MGKTFLRNSALALVGIVSMIALGWAAAKIAGPTSASQSRAASSGWSLSGLFGGKTFDLSGLQAWKDKYPHVVVNGHALFDDPGFIAAMNSTMGEERYQLFSHEKDTASKFLIHPVEQDGEVLRTNIANLAGDNAFDATIFMDTKKGVIDVYWKEYRTQGGWHSEMMLHNGDRFEVDQGRLISDIKHAQLASAEKYTTFLKGEQAKFLGTWKGEYDEKVGNARLFVKRSITITGDPAKPGGLHYSHEENMEARGGTFTCTKTSTNNRVFEGVVQVSGDTANFEAKTISNPNCGTPTFFFKLINGALVRHARFDDAPMKGGQQILTKVN